MATSYVLTPSPTTVTEGGQVTFTITRSGDKPAETIYFSARSDGTATWGEGDFSTTSGTIPLNVPVSFGSGVTSQTATLNIINDGQSDSGEQFRTIVQRNSSDPASQFLAQSSFVTINDAAQNTSYAISPSPTTVTEGGQVTFTITRSGDKPSETVYFSARSDGTATWSEGDFSTTSGSIPLNIPVSFGSGITSQTVTLNITNDGQNDSGEQFRTIVQRNSSDAASVFLAQSGFVTINDAAQNTSYSLTPSPTTAAEGGQVTFTITRTGDKPAETIYFSARSDGTATWSEGDFSTTSGTIPLNIPVSFSSGVTAQTVTLNINNDGVSDSGEQFRTIVQRNSSDAASVFLAQSSFVTINDAAQNTTYSLAPSPTTVTEGGQVTFTITRTGDKPAETIYFSARADGTATWSEGDFSTTSGTIPLNIAVSFASGVTSQTVTMNITNDGVSDSGEQFRTIVQRNSSDDASVFLAQSGFVTINDSSAQNTTYSLTPSATSVTEGGQVTFTVTRSGDMPAETVYFSARADGTANWSEGDFSTTSGTIPLNIPVSFGSGVTSQTVTMNITNDGVSDSGEQFRTIVQRNSADDASVFVAQSGFVTINDAGTQNTTYSMTPSATTVTEGGQITFTVTRSGDKPAETVYFSARADGTANWSEGDFSTTSGTIPLNVPVSFGAGVTSQTVTLNITNDGVSDPGEQFRTIVQRNSADDASVYLAQSAFVTINEGGTNYAVAASPATVTEGGQVIFTITRSGSSLPAETLYASTVQNHGSVNQNDYAINVNNLVVSFALGETSKAVSLSTVNDSAPENDETFGFIIQRNATDPISTSLANTTFTIHDNDIGSITKYSVTASNGIVANVAGTTVSFYVTRSGDLLAETVFASTVSGVSGWSTNNGLFGDLSGQAVTFAAGATSSTTPITLTLSGHSLSEAIANFGVIVQKAVGAISDFVAQTNFSIKPQVAFAAETQSFTIPLPFSEQDVYISQSYGDGDHGKIDASHLADAYFQYAIDFVLVHKFVLAEGTGVVVESRDSVNDGENSPDHFGNYVTIRYNKDTPQEFYATYMHLEKAGVLPAGSQVFSGTKIGTSGDTGTIDDGGIAHPHLHVTYGGDRVLYTSESDQASNESRYNQHYQITMADGSLDTNGTFAPVHFNIGTLHKGDTPDGDNFGICTPATTYLQDPVVGSGPKGTLSVVGEIGATINLALAALGDQCVVTNTDTEKVVVQAVQFGKMAFDKISGLVVGSLNGTGILHHTVNYNGTDGDDHLDASATDTSIVATGGGGNDVLVGGLADDTLSGGSGSDSIDGRGGIDTVDYSDAKLGVIVNLSLLQDQATGADIGTDQISNIENVIGGSGDDQITGNAQANRLDGGGGHDVLRGLAGDDVLIATSDGQGTSGGPGSLTLKPGPEGQDVWVTSVFSYDDNYGVDGPGLKVGGWGDYYDSLLRFDLSGGGTPGSVTSATLRLYNTEYSDYSPTGMYVDRLNTAWTESYGWHDYALSYSNIATTAAPGLGWIEVDVTAAVNQWLQDPTSNFGLQLRPVSNNHTMDYFVSSDATGAMEQYRPELVLAFDQSRGDVLDGGEGVDTVDYLSTTLGIVANLSAARDQVVGGEIGADQLTAIENVIGGSGNDQITGNGGANRLEGGAGNDTLRGDGDGFTGQGNLAATVNGTILEFDGSGFDATRVESPTVVKVGGAYKMLYGGLPFFNNYETGLATSSDGATWTKYSSSPVISNAGSQSWASFREIPVSLMYENGIYKLWFYGDNRNLNTDAGYASGFGYATSTDGVSWNFDPSNPIRVELNSPSGNGINLREVVKLGAQYHAYFFDNNPGGGVLKHAVSDDGIHFSSDAAVGVPSGYNIMAATTTNLGGGDVVFAVLQQDSGAKSYAVSSDGQNFSLGGTLALPADFNVSDILFDDGVIKFFGSAGVGNVNWNFGNEVIRLASAPLSIAGAGNDVLIGGAGDDTLIGGGGVDVAIFSGNRAQYQVSRLANGDIVITDLRTGDNDGTDIIREVENFRFADGTFAAADVLNNAPANTNPIANQLSAEDAFWTYQCSANTFSDIDSDGLTLAATMGDGSALPAWLSFNGGTRTFSGTPPVDFNGVLDLKVTASDGQLSASDTFSLTITPVNDAPVVANAIADQSFAEDMAWTAQVPAGAFADVDSATLSYSATLGNGAALPSWLNFNGATRTFSGTPPLNYNGAIDLKVTASDGALSASDIFTLTVTPVNDAPQVNLPSGASVTAAAHGAVFQLSSLFTASDVDNDALSYMILDNTVGGNSGHFNIAGVAQSEGGWIGVSAAQLSQITFTAGLNATDTIYFYASDGPTSDLKGISITAPANHVPVISLPSGASVTASAHGQVLLFSTLFSASDADNDALSYMILDNTVGGGSGHFNIGGIAQSEGGWIGVTAAQLSQVTFTAGLNSTDSLYFYASDGLSNDIKGINLAAPANHAPVINLPSGASVTASAHGQVLQFSSLFSASDGDNDALSYMILDNTVGGNSGHFNIAGVAQSEGGWIGVSAAQLSQITFTAGLNSTDALYFYASDGLSNDIKGVNLTAPANHAPVINLPHGANITASSSGQVFPFSSLFNASDADNDALSYMILDNTVGGNSGHFNIAGVAQSEGGWIGVSAAQLSQTTYTSGTSGADDIYLYAADQFINDLKAIHLSAYLL